MHFLIALFIGVVINTLGHGMEVGIEFQNVDLVSRDKAVFRIPAVIPPFSEGGYKANNR